MRNKAVISGLIVLCDIHIALAGIPCRTNGQTPGAKCGLSDASASNVTFDPECRSSLPFSCVWRDSYMGCYCSSDIQRDICAIGNTDEVLTDSNTGISYRILYNDNSGSTECTKTTHYICPVGYYGAPTSNSMSECTLCPNGGTSELGLNIDITNCFIPANTPQTDTSGEYIYTSPCYYSE